MDLFDDLTEWDSDTVTLLADAGWITVTREWWHDDGDMITKPMVRSSLKRTVRSGAVWKEWRVTFGEWKECRSVPEAGRKSGKRYVARLTNCWAVHAVEFTLTSLGAKRLKGTR